MTIKEYYHDLPDYRKAEFRDAVMKKTGISIDTFYRYVRGASKPTKLYQDAISEIAGKGNELWEEDKK